MQYSRHAHETRACLPTYLAEMYTLIPTVYRALLKSSISGTDHWIHTTKEPLEKHSWQQTGPLLRQASFLSQRNTARYTANYTIAARARVLSVTLVMLK